MAGKGGGAWKVAYADFVTAMMAFFLVMWITSQNDDVKKAIGGYFQDPWGRSTETTSPTFHSATGLKGDAPFAEVPTGVLPDRWPQVDQENATEKNAGAASVWQQKQRVHLLTSTERTLPALVVNFDEASAELSKPAQDRLTNLLPALIGKRNKLEIRAHSTRRPLPTNSPFRDHWQLCYERSLSTMRFLETKGVEPERIRLSQSAAYDPLTTRFETAWQDENNCVEVFLLTEVVEDVPGTSPTAPAHSEPSKGDKKQVQQSADHNKPATTPASAH
jgi:chemotaxis protein MotB